jgi:hypothetical protein
MALSLPGVSWSAVYEFTNGLYLDESGNVNTISPLSGSPSFVVGRNGASASAFQGSAGTILGRTSPLAGFNPLSNQLTLSAWIKTSSSGKEVIATMGRTPSSNEGEWIWGISSGRLYFWDYREGLGFVETSVSTTSVNSGQWRHVAFVRNELTGTFYVDGTPAGTMTAAKNVSYINSGLVIGGDYRDAKLHWTGQLDDFSVSSTALTPAQILLAAFPFSYTTGTSGVTITGYWGAGGRVEIPAKIEGVDVTTIGFQSFYGSSVTEVVIPENVTAIGEQAFAGSRSMTKITFPNSLTSIGKSAFLSCDALASISIPIGVTTIESNTFEQCINLASVALPSNLTRINFGAFFYCTKLTTISIPSEVTTIEGNTFFNCATLASVYFLRNTPPTIGSNAFLNIASGANGYYPATATETAIPAWASLTKIDDLTIVHPDTQPPVITLIGANPLTIYKGSAFTDPGATVTDNRDVTRSITGTGTVITATVGNYTRTYNATDAAGNLAVLVTRTVNVVLDPSGDEDGDGVNNGAESSAGTNPLVKNILRFQTIDMLALGKGNFSIPESNGAGGGTTPAGFRFGTAAYYGGVPFFISNQANQVWHAARAPGGDGSGPVSVTFPMAVNNVYGFYTLAGLWWGVAGSYVTYTFNFSDGSSYSKELTNNVDLRDYNIPSSFANSINGTTTQNVFVSGNYHLDRQWIDFSPAGHGGKNLVSFTVIDRGASGSSRIFLAAATAQVGAPGQIPPGATDTDGDGILDSYELGLPLSTKPDDADTDDDGLSDGTEISGTTDPLVANVDNDGLNDGVEFAIGTNPLVADSDGDGTPDGDEDADNDGGSNRIEVGLGNSLTVANVYNRLINGSFEDGTVKPSPGGFLAVPQDDVPGWRTTANNNFLIELWYSGFLGSSGNDGNTLAELNYIASGTLYQDVTMTVNSLVSYSFLHRGRDGSDVMDFKIDELSGGPETSVAKNKFTRRVTTGTSWVRYSGSQATSVEAGKTYRFSYTSISPTGGSGNLLDDASFGIDQDGDSLLDYEELALGTNPLDFDSDNDGLKDGEEVITYGTNPLLEDTDVDGAPDGDEVTAGTNPKDSASAPNLPIAYNDAFTAKLVVGMTTKVTTASLISNDKYSSIPEDDRGVTFVSAQPTSSGGASIRIKGGWLIYQPSSSARIGTSDTFTYTVSNGVRDAAGTLKTATGTVTVSLVSPDMTIEVALVSPATPANAYKATFLVMPGLVFEAYGSDTPDGTYTKIGSTWTSASSGKLEVTDTAAAGKSSRFYKLKWVP